MLAATLLVSDDFRGGVQAVSPWTAHQKHFILLLYWVHFVHIFLKLYSQLFFFEGLICKTQLESKVCFYSDF